MSNLVIFVISIMVALTVSASCSLMESVLLSLSPGQIAEISAKRPKTGAYWSGFKRNIDKPISVILILNTTAHTIGAAVAGAAFDDMFDGHYMWLFSIAFTFVMLQYTEILPKTLGVRFNRKIAMVIARPLYVATMIFQPLIWLLRRLNRPFEPRKGTVEYVSAVDELRYIATLARQNNQIIPLQEDIIKGATSLSKKTARDVMIPIADVVCLSTDMSLWDAIEIAHLDAHTRFPVRSGANRSKIVGYVNFKEIISHQRLNPRASSFQEIIRPIAFVDAEAPSSVLLRLFTAQHEHLAMIQNKKKQCIGMVTLEDIVEELLGELEDEFDRLPRHSHTLPHQVLVVGGGCLMHDVRTLIAREILNQPLEKSTDYSGGGDELKTLALWLRDNIGRDPVRGDSVVHKGIEFNVRRVRRGKIFDVQIQKSEQVSSSDTLEYF